MLLKDGFLRPVWFTTYHPVTDARYNLISTGKFHMACADDKVLAYMKYGSDFVGIMKDDFEYALNTSSRGVLIVGPQEIIAMVFQRIPQAIIFTLKDLPMEISPHLAEANKKGQLHRIDVNVLQPGAWSEVHNAMLGVLKISS
jgi:hypothetical protein